MSAAVVSDRTTARSLVGPGFAVHAGLQDVGAPARTPHPRDDGPEVRMTPSRPGLIRVPRRSSGQHAEQFVAGPADGPEIERRRIGQAGRANAFSQRGRPMPAEEEWAEGQVNLIHQPGGEQRGVQLAAPLHHQAPHVPFPSQPGQDLGEVHVGIAGQDDLIGNLGEAFHTFPRRSGRDQDKDGREAPREHVRVRV